MASFSDEAVYFHENIVWGHHVYKLVWFPDIGEVLQPLREEDDHDHFAVPYSSSWSSSLNANLVRWSYWSFCWVIGNNVEHCKRFWGRCHTPARTVRYNYIIQKSRLQQCPISYMQIFLVSVKFICLLNNILHGMWHTCVAHCGQYWYDHDPRNLVICTISFPLPWSKSTLRMGC